VYANAITIRIKGHCNAANWRGKRLDVELYVVLFQMRDGGIPPLQAQRYSRPDLV
jgi:hypothetical protein